MEFNNFSAFCGALRRLFIYTQMDGVLSGSASLRYNPHIQFPTFPSLPILNPVAIPTFPM